MSDEEVEVEVEVGVGASLAAGTKLSARAAVS